MRNQFDVLTVLGGNKAPERTDAADLIAAKLAKLEGVRERMRKVNTLVRNRNAKGLKRLGYADSKVARLLQPDSENRGAFYTDYKLRNNYQQIMSLRRLARKLETVDRSDVSIDQDEYMYREDVSTETISFRFMAKPDKALRALLRRAGFVLRPSRNTYERALDFAGIEAASGLREHLNKRMH